MSMPQSPGGTGPQGGALFLTVFQNMVTAINNLSQTFSNVWPRVTGSFTMPGGSVTSFAVAQPAIKATSVVMLSPANASAGTLMGGTTSLFVSSITPGTGFTVATAAGNAGTGGQTFSYAVFSPS